MKPSHILLCTSLLIAQLARAQNIPFYTQYGQVEKRVPIGIEKVKELWEERLEKITQQLDSTRKDSAKISTNVVATPREKTKQLHVLNKELIKLKDDSALVMENIAVLKKEKSNENAFEDEAAIRKWYKEQAAAVDSLSKKRFETLGENANRAESNSARMDRRQSFKIIDAQERTLLRNLHSSKFETGVFWVLRDGSQRGVERYFEPYTENTGGFLQSNTLHLNPADSKASIYSELYYDYFGPLRLGIGGQLSTASSAPDSTTAAEAEEESEEQLAQRVLGGGGNLVGNFALPVIAYSSPNGKFSVRTLLQPRFSMDLQAVSADSSKVPYHADIAGEVLINVTGNRGVISGFLGWRPSLIIGGPAFYDRLSRGGYRPLEMNQLRIGIGIANVARISYLFVGGDDYVRDTFRSQVSIQILTSALAGK